MCKKKAGQEYDHQRQSRRISLAIKGGKDRKVFASQVRTSSREALSSLPLHRSSADKYAPAFV
jgi:hypothetical protein